MAPNTKSASLIVVLVAAGIIIFVLGGFSGMLLKNSKGSNPIGSIVAQNPDQKASVAVKTKVITSLSMMGQVKGVSGKTITILSGGDSAQVNVTDSTRYYSVDYTRGAPAQSDAKFSDVKAGSTVNINAKILDNDTFSAQTVTIYITKK